MRTLGLVPCKARSTGIPQKNTRIFRGRPLFAWAVGIGRITCDDVYVSTDDVDIARLATMYGAKTILRPPELATDEAPMLPVIHHALSVLPGFDVVVLLQPTSPWRMEKHIRAALEIMAKGADSVMSVVEIPAAMSPDYAMEIVAGQLRGFQPAVESRTRRQDCRAAYYRDGTVYAYKREIIEQGRAFGFDCRPLIIPAHESVTLDTEEDWAHANRATVGG